MSEDDWGGSCPYCDSATGHINNHIRMSTGEHGAQGSYPDDWDSDARERATAEAAVVAEPDGGTAVEGSGDASESVEPPESDGSDGGPESQTVHGLEQPDEDTTGAVPLKIGDDPTDAREYDCGDCETSMEYLAPECGECGQSNAWIGVTA